MLTPRHRSDKLLKGAHRRKPPRFGDLSVPDAADIFALDRGMTLLFKVWLKSDSERHILLV